MNLNVHFSPIHSLTPNVAADLCFLPPLAFSFLQVGLLVRFGLHGAGDARDDAAALRSGQRLLLHLHRSFSFGGALDGRSGVLLFLLLQAL